MLDANAVDISCQRFYPRDRFKIEKEAAKKVLMSKQGYPESPRTSYPMINRRIAENGHPIQDENRD